jgi:hypothetical protein
MISRLVFMLSTIILSSPGTNLFLFVYRSVCLYCVTATPAGTHMDTHIEYFHKSKYCIKMNSKKHIFRDL